MAELDPDQSLPVEEDALKKLADEAVILYDSAGLAAEKNAGLEKPVLNSGEVDVVQTPDNPEESSMELDTSKETKDIEQQPVCEFTEPREMLLVGEEMQPSKNSDDNKIDTVEDGHNSPPAGEFQNCIDEPLKNDISEKLEDVAETACEEDSAVKMNNNENPADNAVELTPAVNDEPEMENIDEIKKAQDTHEQNKSDRTELEDQADEQDPPQQSETAANGPECATENTTREEKINCQKMEDGVPEDISCQKMAGEVTGDIKCQKMAEEVTGDIRKESCAEINDSAQNKPEENEDQNVEQVKEKSEHKNKNNCDQKVEGTPAQGNGGTGDIPRPGNAETTDPPGLDNVGTVAPHGQGNAATVDPPPAPVTFQCEKCRYHTRNKVLFDNHFCDNEDEDNDLEETTLITLKVDESKTYHCSECNISGQGHAFEEHLMCHIILRPYKCLYCSLCFINRREIGRHLAKLHAGQKMNCALRALRRAKALMSAAVETGTYSFYARVAGKVPLSSDKYRSAKLKDGADKAGPSQEPAATSSKTDPDSAIPAKSCTPDVLSSATKVEASDPKPSTSGSSPSSDVKRKEVTDTESTAALTTEAGMEKTSTCQSKIQMTGEDEKGSREYAGNSSAGGNHGSSGVEKMDTREHLSQEAVEGPLLSSFDQNEEEESSAGLKIVAAFSLHDDIDNNSCDSDRLRRKAAENSSNRPSVERSVKEADNDLKDSVTQALGPPSKPTSASSFFDQPQAVGSSAQTPAPGSALLQTNCFFFICGFHCKYSSLTSPEFRDHLMLDHAGESVFSCYHCGYQAQTEDALVRHISAHAHTYSKSAPLYICGASACKFGSNLVADFINHQSSWHSDLIVFQCHDCDEKFDSVEHLLKHFENNFLSIINCPHCTAKTTNRMMLLNHISSAHPGKGKMVSVAKQIVCRDRKLNNYALLLQQRSEAVVPKSPPILVKEVKHQNVVTFDLTRGSRNKSLVSILTEPINSKEKELTRQAQAASARKEFEMKSEAIFVEEEEEDDFDNFDESGDEDDSLTSPTKSSHSGEIAYMGSKADDRETDNFKCKYCTFIARDRCRLEGHERCHGLPPSRRSRFKCMYCPQGFNNEHKFNSHVSCHPGLIKFSLYCCKRCDFDSNQRHIIVKHVRSTRDQAHMSYGASDDDMYTVVSKTMETRVLECTQCSYMTRHRKHLIQHIKRDHSSPRKSGITVDCDIIEKYPTQPANRNRALELAVNHDRSASLPVGDDGNIRENQARRFKCPICQYLVPRAADLKAHVKRHSEIGEITLVMFRCKYCSAASTAREIIYGHLMEKHLGKQIALVKRIVTIDTKGGDNGYAVTSMEDEEDGTVETHPPAATAGSGSGVADKTVLLIPDSAGEIFQSLMECPCCAFASYNRKVIIQHVSTHHPEVNIMGRKADNEVYPLDTSAYNSSASSSDPSSSSPFLSSSAAPKITLGEVLKGEILIVPDSQTFDEPVICPKCDYATIHRRNIVLHLEQNHPGVSVMGRNDYPTFEGKSQEAMEANATGKDGMVIIGSGSLDEKIGCLYENFGDRMKCMICRQERPKKFFIHVHILRHLNILLWGCLYCSHRGLQKYKMMDHIKKVHPGKAYCIRYLPVNVEEKVNEYLQNASMIRARRLGDDTGETVVSPNKSPVIATSESDLDSIRLKHKVSQDRLSGCTIGSEDLDMKLACLYSVSEDGRFKCVVCAQEFQRKFAIHRHIVQSHLKVNLIGCGYCALESVERHIVMDHILETHRSAPISMRNLAENLENKVAEFLSRMTLDADAALDLDEDFSFRLPEPPSLPSMLPPLDTSSPLPSTSASLGSKTAAAARSPSLKASTSGGGGGSGSKNQLNPKLMLLGRDVLHRYLQPLLDDRTGLKCKVCHWDFPRRYAVHRHILMKHLKVGIIGCPYCSFEGVERYQVFTHIKEDHRDAELKMRYLDIDLPAVVVEFQRNLASGKVDNSRTPPPWSIKKIPKKELSDEDDESSRASGSNDGHSDSLVVAMFGKKSGAAIKEEPADEDSYGQEPLDREVNGDDENSVGFDSTLVLDSDGVEREVTAMSLQAANGTKAKSATDVQTSIRVITIKENGCKRHVCEKCKFTSLHRSNIVRHIYRVHEQYREQECPACNYKTLSRVLIEQHIRNEHPGTPLPKELSRNLKRKLDLTPQEMEYDSMKKCKAAAFSKRREADRELLNMSNGTIYACAYCRFETSTREEIARHTRENHQAVAQPVEGMEEDIKEESDDFGEIDEDRQEEGFEGGDNDFETLTSTVKMNQVDLSKGSEDALWQCYYCSYKTAVEEDLKIHFSEAHSGNVYRFKRVPTWRFVCRSCHVKTRAHSKMRYHLNRHINYRPYTCTTCGSFYPSPDQCRKHCRANNHNETFTYVKIPRKEKRLQELLKECQEIAVALTKSEDTNISIAPSKFFSIPSKRKAKKSFPPTSKAIPAKLRKSYEYDAPYSPRGAPPKEAVSSTGGGSGAKEEIEAKMVCGMCEFTAQNVCEVWLHFIDKHERHEFQWQDASTGYLCTETGEITNGKENPPNLDAPPGPGYSQLGKGMLSCHHCQFTTSTVQAMKSHLRRHLPKRYLCPYCSMRCSRRDTINQHVRCGHRGREMWTIFFRLPEGFTTDQNEGGDKDDGDNVVPEPSVSFQTEENDEEATDVENEGAEKPPQLPSGEGSVNRKARKSFVRPSPPVVTMERIKCGICDLRMESVASVYRHHLENHKEQEFLWVDTTNGYTCRHSGEVMDAKELSPHLFSKDGFSVESDTSNVPTFACKFCPFTSAFIQAIKSHMKSHLPHGFMCPYCCMVTNSKEKMISHQSCSHRDQEPWILHLRMPLDGAASSPSSSASSMEKNLLQRGTGKTNYACIECDYTTENLTQFRLHLANHGNYQHLVKDIPEDLPFRCGYCVFVAEDEGEFGAHIASHLERRNFRCSKCEYTAFKRASVLSHIQSSHSETEEVEVIDLQASNISEQGGSVEEPQLVNFSPKVKVAPISELDLNREGLTLYSPPSSSEGDELEEGEDIIGLADDLDSNVSGDENDDRSDCTEVWGVTDETQREEDPPATQSAINRERGGSILRLTLQGKLTGEYGIKRAYPADLAEEASPSQDSESSDPDSDNNEAGESEEAGEREAGLGEDMMEVDVSQDLSNSG